MNAKVKIIRIPLVALYDDDIHRESVKDDIQDALIEEIKVTLVDFGYSPVLAVIEEEEADDVQGQ